MNSATLGALGLLLAVAGAAAAFFIGLRRAKPIVVDAVRTMNRRFVNPRQLKTAGTPGAYASIIVHRGRESGRRYETPVGAVPIGDGFAIALVYGRKSDWVQNVLTAGAAELVHEGVTYRVHSPEVVAAAAAAGYFSPADQRAHRAFRVRSCLLLQAQQPRAGYQPGTPPQ